MRPSPITGLDHPSPGRGTFHLMFLPFLSCHTIGSPFASVTLLPVGPRKRGQEPWMTGSSAVVGALELQPAAASAMQSESNFIITHMHYPGFRRCRVQKIPVALLR